MEAPLVAREPDDNGVDIPGGYPCVEVVHAQHAEIQSHEPSPFLHVLNGSETRGVPTHFVQIRGTGGSATDIR